MKWKSKAVTLSAMLVATSILGACGNNKDSNDAANRSSPTSSAGASSESVEGSGEADLSKQLELSVAIWDVQTGYDAPGAKDDTVYNDLTKQFNVSIKPVQITWNDWQDKLKVWAASNQLPDIFANAIATDNPGLYETWAKQGVIKPLPDDMSAYPNLEKTLSLPSVQPLKIDGKYYMIPRMTYNDSSDWVLDRPIRYRKDWAAEAGYTKDPASFEEFLAMAKAVMKKHPGVLGLTIPQKGYLLTSFLGSFPEMTNVKTWVNEEGKWIPAFASAKAYTGIQQLRQLYTEGVLDPDFAIGKDGDGESKFLSGQSFALFGLGDFSGNKFTQFKKANPGVQASEAVGFMNIWPAADGKRYSFVETPYWSEVFFRNDLSDEKFDRALRLLDYMASEEYLILAGNGIEGVDFKFEDGKAVSLLKEGEVLDNKYPITKNLRYLAQWGNGFGLTNKKVVSSDSDQAAVQQNTVESYNRFKQEDTPTPINFDVMLLSTPAKNKLGSLQIPDDIIKVIIGKGDPVEQWKQTVKGYDAKGVQEAIKEVNEEVAKRGIK